jgi:predicted nuclease of predicted toxin-antitoxin system
MKLLFDQNISFRILQKLDDVFQEAEQVRTVGLEGATDSEIWNYAQEHDYAIVTFDADFADIAYLRGFPPKIIWLRTGNMITQKIADLLYENREIMKEFLTDEAYEDIACLELEQ